MAAVNIKSMSVDDLLSLRSRIEGELSARRGDLEKQLSRIAKLGGGGGLIADGRGRSTKGRKVAPKFRGPGGETWAGRGARPRWLTALLKDGRKLEEFAIGNVAGARKKVAKKRSARKQK